MSIAKNTKETYLEEIIDNLSGNTRELPVDCKPRTREEILLAEIEKNTRDNSNGGSIDPEALLDYVHKVNDKATVNEFTSNSDEHYVTPMMLINAIKQLSEQGEFNVLLSVNGRTGNVVLSRSDVELDNVMNIKQATKVEFDAHCNDGNVHLTKTEKDNLYVSIGSIGTNLSSKLDKTLDKASILEVVEGLNDSSYATPLALKTLLDSIIQPSLKVYDLKSYGVDDMVIAEILPGQSYYTNVEVSIGTVTFSTQTNIATEHITIKSSDCINFENVTLFVK